MIKPLHSHLMISELQLCLKCLNVIIPAHYNFVLFSKLTVENTEVISGTSEECKEAKQLCISQYTNGPLLGIRGVNLFRGSINHLCTLPSLNHHTSMWYKLYIALSINRLRQRTYWWWLNALERMKLIVPNKMFQKLFICSNLLHSDPWCRMQWTTANCLVMPSAAGVVRNPLASSLLNHWHCTVHCSKNYALPWQSGMLIHSFENSN